MAEKELLPFAASLGVGGVLALAMFLIHRSDMKQHIENWKGQSEGLLQVVRENTAAITKLIEKIDQIADRQ